MNILTTVTLVTVASVISGSIAYIGTRVTVRLLFNLFNKEV